MKLQSKMDDVNSRAIVKYGMKLQSVVCMEECAELSKEVSKFIRGKGSKEALTEEIRDVYICLDMLRKMYAISSGAVADVIRKKLERTGERMRRR